jgi:hypothetical protein
MTDPFDQNDLPRALLEELRAMHARVEVPATVDSAVLREARAGFARRRRFRLAFRGAAAVAAAAAVIAIALPLFRTREQPAPQQARVTSSKMLSAAPEHAREDADGDGKVDILDALVVAKLIDARKNIDETYDVNGDGKVDQSDVDRIATVAVDTTRLRQERVQ